MTIPYHIVPYYHSIPHHTTIPYTILLLYHTTMPSHSILDCTVSYFQLLCVHPILSHRLPNHAMPPTHTIIYTSYCADIVLYYNIRCHRLKAHAIAAMCYLKCPNERKISVEMGEKFSLCGPMSDCSEFCLSIANQRINWNSWSLHFTQPSKKKNSTSNSILEENT